MIYKFLCQYFSLIVILNWTVLIDGWVVQCLGNFLRPVKFYFIHISVMFIVDIGEGSHK